MRLAILISGGGTTAEAIIKACQRREILGIKPVIVISSKKEAPGIQKAKNLGIKTVVVSPKNKNFGKKLLNILKKEKIDLISQNGWLPLTPKEVVREFWGRIINQHPGPLDPGRIDFGGKGMYGARVICARLIYEWVGGEKKPWTESDIHWVNEEYDRGELIRVVSINLPPHSPITLKEIKENPHEIIEITKRVQTELLPVEHQNVISVLKLLSQGEKIIFYRPFPLIPKEKTKLVLEAKKLACELFPHG